MLRSLWDLIHRPASLCRHHFYKTILCIIAILLASQYMFNIFVYQSNNYFSFNLSSWSSLYSHDIMTNKLQITPPHVRTRKIIDPTFSERSSPPAASTLGMLTPLVSAAAKTEAPTSAPKVDVRNSNSSGIHTNSTMQSNTSVVVVKSTSKPMSQNSTTMTITTTTTAINKDSLTICPLIPPKLVGPVKVWTDAPTFEELEKMHPELEIGGRFRPKECVSRHKVAIIIPYRDREEHLRLFLHNLHPILQRQQLDYGIYVIEQKPNTKFNRAKLMNVGYAESLKQYDYQCFIFHDVDLLPEDDRNLYSCPEQPRHMSVAIDTFKYKLPYDKLFGGVSALSKAHMEKINGFSNQFWGWGGEDDDMANRVVHHGYHISRYPLNIARYKMMKHKKDPPNPNRYKMLYKGKLRYKSDGINSLHYKRMDILLKRLYTWVFVDLEQPKNL